MWISRANSSRLGGCSRRTPWIRSSAAMSRRSLVPLLLLPSSRSSVLISRIVTFHWKLFCRR